MSGTPHPDGRRPAGPEARIDLQALRGNVEVLQRSAGSAAIMAVVKANAYGHGLVPCALAAQSAGANWLGTATPREALALRRAAVGGRILCWLWTPDGPFSEAVSADIDISVSGRWALDKVCEAAAGLGRSARVHLKADTGLGRNGCTPADWTSLLSAAMAAQKDGLLNVVGVWSHLACADEPTHPSIDAQVEAFRHAVAAAERFGADLEVRHLANSAATLLLPETRFDLVRTGLSLFGLSPAPEHGTSASFGLRPVMTLVAPLASVKRVPAGHGVSYGHDYRTATETSLGLVPVGFGAGIPRHASGAASVAVAGRRYRAVGRIAMDQFVIDLGDSAATVGDEVVLFGPGERGEPTAEDWARAAGTIAYEIVTRIASDVPRVYLP
ncbi:alanine racemase [Kitasatospora kifunensis]|uniref:Alanine racemase n=1 Tax=Kitasatospora kifunensis TaxID=58351 RepID=A0A7W7R9D2_KITKI|nr:alanine racemase [Kitasatospora kifunensis]MBB4927865.1 alanine racemase [Kitasatospora kifunensis]